MCGNIRGHLDEGAAERRVRGLVGRRLRGGRLVAAASAEQDKAGEEKNGVWLGHAGCPHGCVMIVESRKERPARSEEHTSELQSLIRFSYAFFCLTIHIFFSFFFSLLLFFSISFFLLFFFYFLFFFFS